MIYSTKKIASFLLSLCTVKSSVVTKKSKPRDRKEKERIKKDENSIYRKNPQSF